MILEVVRYRSEWQEQFLDLGRRIRAAMENHALRIDHIGSTAVHGLSAKPIIDVQLTVVTRGTSDANRKVSSVGSGCTRRDQGRSSTTMGRC